MLRKLTDQAPQVAPQLARAWLDDQLATATAEGGFDRAARLQSNWQKLGQATKDVLFPGAQQKALDNYFLLAKKISEQPNPSRTALVGTTIGSAGLIFTEPLTGASLTLGGGVLARILRNATAVKALTRGLTVSLSPGMQSSAALRATAAADVVKAAREAGVMSSAVPALATGASGKGQP